MAQGISVPVLTNYHYHDVERKMATMLLDCAKMEQDSAALTVDAERVHHHIHVANVALHAVNELAIRIERRDNAHLDQIIDEASDQLDIPRVYRGVLVE
jgi:hypothetical protein